jgi:hypothetical protein
MDNDEKTHDLSFCLRKEAENYAKARTATDPKLISSYNAIAREYAYRAMLLKETQKA